MNCVKPFYIYLLRGEDESGVSGTGVVAVGVQYPSGHCILEWIIAGTSLGIYDFYDSAESMMSIHGHQGKTRLCWGTYLVR